MYSPGEVTKLYVELENRRLNGESNLENSYVNPPQVRIAKSKKLGIKPQTNQFTCGHLILGFYKNCRCLRSKLATFRFNATAFDHYFKILIETWLTNGVFDNELNLYN